MKKSDLIHYLMNMVPGDPEILIEDRRTDGVAREAQILEEVLAVTAAAMRSDERIFWQNDDAERPATYPGDSPDDPEPVIALVLR